MNKKNLISKLIILVVVAVFCVVAGKDFLRMHQDDVIAETQNLTEVRMLSDWNPALKGTGSDTPVYVLKGEEEGGSMLLLGGTHENEIAAVMSAITFIENANVQKGTLYVIPHANGSAITHTLPLEALMDEFDVTLADGSVRTFRIGCRYTNPVDQWPDPNYYFGSSGRYLTAGETAEIRNLNRNYPGIGEENLYLTQRACYAIYNLVVTEGIDLLYDGHEANSAFKRVDYMIAHNNAMPLASTTSLNLMFEGIDLKVDLSGATSWGLSHRALGDNTDALCTLVETLNPAMGVMHGKINYDMVVGGKDAVMSTEAAKQYAIDAQGTVLTDTNGNLNYRTGYHMEVVKTLIDSYTEMYPDNAIVIDEMPSYETITQQGLGAVLKPVA